MVCWVASEPEQRRRFRASSSSSLLLSSLELSDTKVYEPYIRARLRASPRACPQVRTACRRVSSDNGTVVERLVFYCRTTSASTAPCTSRSMCCLTHCASYCAPCQPLLRWFSLLHLHQTSGVNSAYTRVNAPQHRTACRPFSGVGGTVCCVASSSSSLLLSSLELSDTQSL